MAHIATTESTLTTSDNFSLYTKTWHPPASTALVARLAFVHGFSDHCNFYGVLFPSLAARGIKVYSYDQRGWGRSVRRACERGVTGPTALVLSDLTDFLTALPGDEEGAPLFLMGHSMGGGIVLYYAATGPAHVRRRVRGYLAEAPYIRLHPREMPGRATVLAGRLLATIWPRRRMLRKLDPRHLCRDPDVGRAWERDALCHDTATLEGLAAMMDRAAELDAGQVRIRDGDGDGGATRVWVGFGSGDAVLDFQACRRWFDTHLDVQDKEFKIYDGWYHKLHAEPGEDKFTFAHDVGEWILARSAHGEPGESLAATKPKL